MITSGMLLHVCVFAMLIEGKSKVLIRKKEKDLALAKDLAIKDCNSSTVMMLRALSNINLLWLLLSTFAGFFGVSVFVTHTMAFVESQLFSLSVGSLVISAFAFMSLAGRIVLSLVMQHPKINTLVLYIITATLFGK